MDATAAIVIFMLGILTAMIVVVGVQAYHVLKDLRETIKKANKVLDDSGEITESVKAPVASASNIATDVLSGRIIEKLFSGRGRGNSGKQ